MSTSTTNAAGGSDSSAPIDAQTAPEAPSGPEVQDTSEEAPSKVEIVAGQVTAAAATAADGIQNGDLEQIKDGFSLAATPMDLLFSEHSHDRAQGNLAGLFIGVMVAVIIGVGVVIPVVQDILAESNVSGTTALILGLIPLMIGVMLIVSLASPLMQRM